MIFETLYESWANCELLLIEGGMCRWHLRRDGQLTIHEILSYKPGAGRNMIETISKTPGAKSLFAKCPADMISNGFYAHMGFICEGQEVTPSGRKLNLWRLPL